MKITQYRSLQELGMEGGDPIDGMAPHARKVRHAYIFLARFIDEREPP